MLVPACKASQGGGVESLRAIHGFRMDPDTFATPILVGHRCCAGWEDGSHPQRDGCRMDIFELTVLISMVLTKALPDVAEYYEELLVDTRYPLGKNWSTI